MTKDDVPERRKSVQRPNVAPGQPINLAVKNRKREHQMEADKTMSNSL